MKTLGTVATLSDAESGSDYNDITMSRLDGYGMNAVNADMRGVAYGVAPLNGDAKVANKYLPDVITSDVASISESDIDRIIYGGLGE